MLESQSVPLGSELGENCWLGIGMFLNVDSVILFSLFAKRVFFVVVFQLFLFFFLFFSFFFYQTNIFIFGESQWFK